MDIKSYVLNREDTIANLGILLQTEFSIFDINVIKSCFNSLNEFTKPLKDNLWYITETPYIDKVYRDSFYMFYASKFDDYSRNCIKISIWSKNINVEDFDSVESVAKIQDYFLGFVVIRPTYPNIIGRNAISPKALKKHQFRACCTKIGVTVNGVKFEVSAFPAVSQDEETMTCAEAAIWVCMEYFGFRYVEYRPVLPSDILKALNDKMAERQLPSQGLSTEMIASAIKKFGFGTKVYSKEVYGSKCFDSLLSIYVESGIPIILAIEGNNPHAIVVIGRNIWDYMNIPEPSEFSENLGSNENNIKIIDWNCTGNRKYITIDDNYPPYRQETIESSAKDYGQVKHFVAPLNAKIYLEAFSAKRFIEKLLYNKTYFPIQEEEFGTNIVTRLLLVSSRSYKNWIRTTAVMHQDLKEIIVSASMPKFIWLCELGSRADFLAKKASGLILLDSTESNLQFLNPLIFAMFKGNLLIFAPDLTQSVENQNFKAPLKLQNFGESNKIDFGQFDIFEENLSQP